MSKVNLSAERTVSSPNLYHFTKNIETVKEILQCQYFKVSDCVELYPFLMDASRNVTKKTIPMVCFCDIPRKAREYHKKRYGYYAIAMNKEWANKHKICPVIYCREHGYITDVIKKIVGLKNTEDIKSIIKYCKPYYGKEWIKNEQKISDNYIRFYDEREWRYIPQDNEKELRFTMNDVKWVLVTSEQEKDELAHFIERARIKISLKK